MADLLLHLQIDKINHIKLLLLKLLKMHILLISIKSQKNQIRLLLSELSNFEQNKIINF